VSRLVQPPLPDPVRILAALLVCLLGFQSGVASAQATKPVPESPYRPHDPLNVAAFERFYNLDFDRAVADYERVVEKYPDDPFAMNHLLTGVLFRELYRMGALNTREYENDSFLNAPHHNADPKAKEQIKQLVGRALRLEQRRLEANPKDVDALYARGVTRAQFATYTALIEHAWFSALRNAVGARHDHEKVLELSPGYADAKLVVGAHNYVLGSLPWSVKVAASLVGLGGSREKGIRLLREAAEGGGEAAVDSKVVLVVFLRREHRYEEALELDRQLVGQYPQSSLLALEEGNLLRAMGRPLEAAASYRKVWKSGREGHYPGQHYESSALALGDLLRSQKDYEGAATAYELVNQLHEPNPELKQRASLAAGEMYDVLRKRDLAIKKYQEVIALNSENGPAESARKFMKDAYRE
jgi:tetratricopeptide (TPR) repeat protein